MDLLETTIFIGGSMHFIHLKAVLGIALCIFARESNKNTTSSLSGGNNNCISSWLVYALLVAVNIIHQSVSPELGRASVPSYGAKVT